MSVLKINFLHAISIFHKSKCFLNMYDNNNENKNIEIEESSPRHFGILLSIVFLIFSIYFYKNITLVITFVILTTLCLYLSKFHFMIFKYPNRLWLKFADILSKITNPIIMIILYFVIISPISLILKIFKRSTLDLKFDKNKNGYWKTLKQKKTNIEKQY